jgi:hypothetical protein
VYLHPVGLRVTYAGRANSGLYAWRVHPPGGLRERTLLSGWGGDPNEVLSATAERYQWVGR